MHIGDKTGKTGGAINRPACGSIKPSGAGCPLAAAAYRSPYPYAAHIPQSNPARRHHRTRYQIQVAVPELLRLNNFNHLKCQTCPTALIGAKGIFLHGQTGTDTKAHYGAARYVRSAITRKLFAAYSEKV